jgi:hypothetical protein
MATIFEQALKELDEVKQGLSRSNAVLFKQAIAAADKAEDALKAFISASATAQDSLAEMLKVQTILTGRKYAGGGTRAPRKARDPNAPVTTWKAPKGKEGQHPTWSSDKRGAGPGWYREAKKNGTLDKLVA